MRLKRWMRRALAACLMGLAGSAMAAPTDQITISITPTVNLNIAITTTTVQWNSGDTDLDLTLALGTTDYLVRPATVTYTGSFAGAEVDVQGVDNMPDWTFDADDVAEENQLQVYTLFSQTSVTSSPTLTQFTEDGNERLSGATARMGQTAGDDADGNFLNTAFDATADENLSNNDQMHMWIRVDLPPTSTSTAQQDFSIVLTATNSNL